MSCRMTKLLISNNIEKVSDLIIECSYVYSSICQWVLYLDCFSQHLLTANSFNVTQAHTARLNSCERDVGYRQNSKSRSTAEVAVETANSVIAVETKRFWKSLMTPPWSVLPSEFPLLTRFRSTSHSHSHVSSTAYVPRTRLSCSKGEKY